MIEGKPADAYIYEKLSGYPYEIEILGAWETPALIDKVLKENGIMYFAVGYKWAGYCIRLP
jgi:hypothetical protein